MAPFSIRAGRHLWICKASAGHERRYERHKIWSHEPIAHHAHLLHLPKASKIVCQLPSSAASSPVLP